MKIGALNNGLIKFPTLKEVETKQNSDFGNVLTDFVKAVNSDQVKSADATRDFLEGKDIELHEVMVAGEKAKTSLELLMEIRNKSVDMYKELTRMQ
ncbi:MAG: flagellar hook-basal body complex protein FliE [bacterium]